MPDEGREKPNVILEAFGESRQTIGVRVANDLVLAIHKELVEEKTRARDEELQEPTLTWLVERLLTFGLQVHKERRRQAYGLTHK